VVCSLTYDLSCVIDLRHSSFANLKALQFPARMNGELSPPMVRGKV